MRIYIISQHFLPESPPIAKMMDELARHLVSRGNEVHILTGFPSYPEGELYREFSRKLFETQIINGVHVHRLWSTLYSSGFIKRVLFFLLWSYSVRFCAWKLPRPDVIYVEIPPPSAAAAAIYLGRHFRSPVVARIQDMHPDSAIASGFVRNPLLVKYLRRQEHRIYSNLDKILVVGKGFCRALRAKGVPKQKITICCNWIDVNEIKPRLKYSNPVRGRFSISQTKRVVLYAGTMGRSHGTSIFLDAAKLLQNTKGMQDILFVFVGRGYERNDLDRRIREEKISNVLIFDPVERKDLADMLSMADLTVVSLKPGFGDLSVPSKVLGYMAVGRPVLALADGQSDTAIIVKKACCGEVLKPSDSIGLADAIQRWIHNDELCESAGKEARRYCETHLHHDILLNKLSLELEIIAG